MINKIWKKVKLFLYIKSMKTLLKVGLIIVRCGNRKDWFTVLKVFNERLSDTIYDEYPFNNELRKIKMSLIGYSMGLVAVIAKQP